MRSRFGTKMTFPVVFGLLLSFGQSRPGTPGLANLCSLRLWNSLYLNRFSLAGGPRPPPLGLGLCDGWALGRRN